MIPGMHLLKFVSLGAAEDSPYGLTAPFKDQGGGFKSSWANDMPSFFQSKFPSALSKRPATERPS